MLATVDWTGLAGDGLWSTSANWSTGAPPSAADDVVVPNNASITHATGTDAVNSITCGGGDLLDLSGGSLSIAAASTLDAFTLAGATLAGAGTVTVSGLLTWTGGTMSGTGTTTANGGVLINGVGQGETLDARTLDNNGTTALTGGDDGVTFADGAVWNNAAAAVFDFQSDNPLTSGGTFNNAGLVEKTLPTGVNSDGGVAEIASAFDDNGGSVTVAANAGTLNLDGGGAFTGGILTVDAGATLGLGGGAQINQQATMTVDAASGESGAGTGSFVSGTVNFAGTYDVAGATTTASFPSPTLNFNDPGKLLNLGSTLNLPRGTINFNDGTQTNPNALQFNSIMLGGTANFGFDHVTTQTLDLTGTLTGAGTVTVSGLLTWTGGTMSGTGTTTANGGVLINGVGQGETLDARTLDNNGTATVVGQDNGVDFVNGAVWTNPLNSVLDLEDGGNGFNGGTAGGTLNNAGLVEKTAGTTPGTSGINIAYNNTGTTRVKAATLSFGQAFANVGTTLVDAGTTLQVQGNYTQTAGATTVNGTIQPGIGTFLVDVEGGTLTGAGTIVDNLTNAAQLTPGASPGILTVTGNYTQTATGNLDIELGGTTAGSQFDQLIVSGSVALAGDLNASFINGFAPAVGDTLQVLVFASRTDDFAAKNGLAFTGGSLAPLYSSTNLTLTAQSNAPSRLAFVEQPGDTIAGQTIAPAVTVAVEDANGDVVASDQTDTITLTLLRFGKPVPFVGTKTETVVDGIATFGDLSIDLSASYALNAASASDAGLAEAASKGFNILPGAAANFAFNSTSVVAGEVETLDITALDAFGNTATGYTGSVHFTSSDPHAQLPADSTLQSGFGSFSYALETAGTQSIFSSRRARRAGRHSTPRSRWPSKTRATRSSAPTTPTRFLCSLARRHRVRRWPRSRRGTAWPPSTLPRRTWPPAHTSSRPATVKGWSAPPQTALRSPIKRPPTLGPGWGPTTSGPTRSIGTATRRRSPATAWCFPR